jgi:hypothetical protein
MHLGLIRAVRRFKKRELAVLKFLRQFLFLMGFLRFRWRKELAK